MDKKLLLVGEYLKGAGEYGAHWGQALARVSSCSTTGLARRVHANCVRPDARFQRHGVRDPIRSRVAWSPISLPVPDSGLFAAMHRGFAGYRHDDFSQNLRALESTNDGASLSFRGSAPRAPLRSRIAH